MATRAIPHAPAAAGWFDRALGGGALLLLAMVLAALWRGRAALPGLPWELWVHLGALIGALALTPVQLWRRQGDRWHRRLGWLWAALMLAAALVSFRMRYSNDGGFSTIHLLSAFVVVMTPVLVWRARARNVRAHRSTVRGLVAGGLLTAGFLTLPFDRLLGQWLFG